MTGRELQRPLRALAARLAEGAVSARALVEESLAAIEDPAGEGERAFLSVAASRARAEAGAVDAQRGAGYGVPPFAGVPVAIKDLADVAGEVTAAGSVVLADAAPAAADAVVVARLRAAGFILMGRTNMTEFAYSGLGLNLHHGTPLSPWDRDNGRIPGGSSSGTAVAVADGMVAVGLGTDTGGSCRIPAAYCGIVGYKPTASRVPLDGILPLSPSLDSVGPLGTSVDCCAIVDDVFAGGTGLVGERSRPVGSIRLGALTDFVMDGLDDEVAAGYEAALSALTAAGVTIVDAPFPELTELPAVNRKGGLPGAESWHLHQTLLKERGDSFDFRVRSRIELGEALSASDYLTLLEERRRLIAVGERRLREAGADCFVLPAVANLPPTVASFGSVEDPGYMENYVAKNILALRNTSVGNFLDACAISLPIGEGLTGGPPVGLMLMGRNGDDAALFEVARTVEPLIA